MPDNEFNELNEFDLELQKLKQQMEEIEKKREAKRKEIEMKLPVKIKIISFLYEQKILIFTVHPLREDVLKVIEGDNLSTRMHAYSSFDSQEYRYQLKINRIREFKEKLDTLPNIDRSVANKEIQSIIEEASQEWDIFLSISSDKRYLLLKTNIRIYPPYGLNSIPGVSFDHKTREYKFPLMESWRVYEKIHDLEEKIEYSPGTLEFILEQIKQREELNQLATAEVYEPYLNIDFNGYRLKPFQTVGVRFSILSGGRVILGDEMGLGKTIQAVAFAELKKKEDYPDDPSKFKTLIVCPAHLLINWYRNIKAYTGNDTRIKVFKGLTPSRIDTITALEKKYDYAIMSYHSLGKEHKIKGGKEIDEETGKVVEEEDSAENLWAALMNITQFDCVIFDECHYMANYRSGRSVAGRKIQSRYVIELSGTPLVNRPPELWPILNIAKPEQFPSQSDFVSRYTVDGKIPRNVKDLHELVRPIMIRRLKSDVMKDLPPIERIPRYHTLSPKAEKIYKKALNFVQEYIDELGEKWEDKIPNILAQINKLRLIAGVDKTSTTADLAWEIVDNAEDKEHNKVIAFSFWKATTYKIHLLLNPNSISFVDNLPSGPSTIQVEKRYERCDQFTNDPKLTFLAAPLMSTQEGLDITAAGSCIFNDMWWNPKAHEQAEGRAYGRLIDPHSVNSYYVLAEGTIDEDIWNLVWGEKAGIIKEVVDGVQSNREHSITKALIESIMKKKI